MDKRFNIHDWQAKQKQLNESNLDEAMNPKRVANALFDKLAASRLIGKQNRARAVAVLASMLTNMKIDELNEKEGVKHYTKDGKEWTGATHKMPNGPLMTQNPHSEDSEELFHKDELDEMSTTGTGASFKAGNSAAYTTPKAFKKKKKDLNEVSYSDFKRNTESSPRQKIARGIRQVNRMIKEIEKIVSHNFRLKTELDMNSGTFLKSTNKQIHELGARLKNLENKLREFSN